MERLGTRVCPNLATPFCFLIFTGSQPSPCPGFWCLGAAPTSILALLVAAFIVRGAEIGLFRGDVVCRFFFLGRGYARPVGSPGSVLALWQAESQLCFGTGGVVALRCVSSLSRFVRGLSLLSHWLVTCSFPSFAS